MAQMKKVTKKKVGPVKKPRKPESVAVYKKSFMTNYYADGSAEHRCEVRLSGGTIAVDYADDGGRTVYEGTKIAPGHFRLSSPVVKGRASLHRFPDDDMLEGFWAEGGNVGMWRIQLNDDD